MYLKQRVRVGAEVASPLSGGLFFILGSFIAAPLFLCCVLGRITPLTLRCVTDRGYVQLTLGDRDLWVGRPAFSGSWSWT